MREFPSRDREAFLFKTEHHHERIILLEFRSRNREAFLFKLRCGCRVRRSCLSSFHLGIEKLFFSKINLFEGGDIYIPEFPSRNREAFLFKLHALGLTDALSFMFPSRNREAFLFKRRYHHSSQAQTNCFHLGIEKLFFSNIIDKDEIYFGDGVSISESRSFSFQR